MQFIDRAALAQIEDVGNTLLSNLDNPVVAAVAGMLLTLAILYVIWQIMRVTNADNVDDSVSIRGLVSTLNTVVTEMSQSNREVAQATKEMAQSASEMASNYKELIEVVKQRDESHADFMKGVDARNRIQAEQLRLTRELEEHIATQDEKANQLGEALRGAARKQHQETRQFVAAQIKSVQQMVDNLQKSLDGFSEQMKLAVSEATRDYLSKLDNIANLQQASETTTDPSADLDAASVPDVEDEPVKSEENK